MSNLLPEKWREVLEPVQEKVGQALANLIPWKRRRLLRRG